MRSLREAQRALHEAIVARPAAGAGAGFDPERLAIYRNAYLARLAEALRVNYPALAAFLGDEAFRGVADAYAARRPSRHYSIRWHGEDLASGLEDPRLADLARMEWALGVAFDAADMPPLDAAGLAAVAPEDLAGLALALHPGARVLLLRWEVEPLWEAARRPGDAPCDAPRERPHALVVWRSALQARWRTAPDAEGRALLAIGAKGSLEGACDGASPDEARQIGEWFAGWVASGLLVRRGRKRA